MENQYAALFLCIVINLVITPMSQAFCPLPCACSVHQIDCYGRNLIEIPPDISDTSIYVDLQKNYIDTIQPERLTRLTKVESLNLGRNGLTRLDAGTFANLTVLKRLLLGGNNIEYIDPEAFINLPSLQVLDLGKNAISNITGLFVNIPSIERLVLSFNQIPELNEASLAGLNSLQYLILSQNKISTISMDAFSHVGKLSYLVINSNPIVKADGLWDGLKVLSFLDMSDCQLTRIPFGIPWTLSILRLNNNFIDYIFVNDLREQKYLTYLYIENNLLSHIGRGALAHSPHLRKVDLNGNRLTELPDTIAANIEVFRADNNFIKHVYFYSFGHDGKMTTLSLNNNSISDLAANTFGRLASLTSLYLDNNDIRVMHNMSFMGLRKLKTLSLEGNPVQEIQTRALSGLAGLNQLTLSKYQEKIIDIEGNFFRDTPSIVNLDIHESPALVSYISNSTHIVRSLPDLKILNIKNSNLEYLSTALLAASRQLHWLSATENPWKCDADLLPVRKWMGKSPQQFRKLKSMTCASPPYLKGKSIVDIPLSDFVRFYVKTTRAPPTKTTMTKTSTQLSVSPKRQTSIGVDVQPSSKPTTKLDTKSTTIFSPKSVSPSGFTIPIFKVKTQTPNTNVKSTKVSSRITSSRPSTSRPRSSSTTSAKLNPVTQNPTQSTTIHTAPIRTSKSQPHSSTIKKSTQSPKLSTTRASAASHKQFTRLTTSSIPNTTLQVTAKVKLTTQSQTKEQPFVSQTTNSNVEETSKETQDSFYTSSKQSTELSTSKTNNDNTTPTRTNTMTPSVVRPIPKVTTMKPKPQSHKSNNNQAGAKHSPSISSPTKTDNKFLIIGVSAGLTALVIIAIIVVAMARYRKRKTKPAQVDQDITFTHHNGNTSETVCIINHLHDGANTVQEIPKNNIMGSSRSSSDSKDRGGDKTGKKIRKVSTSSKNSAIMNDDTEMLMDSW